MAVPPPPLGDWHLHGADTLAQAHTVDLDSGLHPDEARRRAAQHGPNTLPQPRQRSPWALLLAQFRDFMVLVLLAAAGVAGALGGWGDTLAIVVIVLLAKPGIATLKDYEAQRKMGIDPVFIPSRCGIEGAELWNTIIPRTYPKELAALKAKLAVAEIDEDIDEDGLTAPVALETKP